MGNKIKVYLASSWFTPATEEIRFNLEGMLSVRPDVELYSPKRDGIMLPPNQRHDTALRESIFNDNISHIVSADLVIANVYSMDSYNDTGTMYEIGYAMANNVPVLGFTTTMDQVDVRFKGILGGMNVVTGYSTLTAVLDELIPRLLDKDTTKTGKVLFVGNGNKDVDETIASYIMDSGANLRWLNDIHNEVYTRIDEIFENVDYMIAVIDDRKTIVSWMIGQAYARGIPVVTYSNYDYGINIMLLVSVLTHIRGTEELSAFLQQVQRQGLESIPKFDISQMDAM